MESGDWDSVRDCGPGCRVLFGSMHTEDRLHRRVDDLEAYEFQDPSRQWHSNANRGVGENEKSQ